MGRYIEIDGAWWYESGQVAKRRHAARLLRCRLCRKKFPSHRRKRPKFCSRLCSAAGRAGRSVSSSPAKLKRDRSGQWWYVWHPKPGNPIRTRVFEKLCLHCRKKFIPRHKGNLHCSRKCSGAASSVGRIGPKAKAWKGGRFVHASGYVYAWIPPEERTSSKCYRVEHRIVMEKVLGRKLRSNERVHHKNGVTTDNRPENLELWAMRGQPSGQRATDITICPDCHGTGRIEQTE